MKKQIIAAALFLALSVGTAMAQHATPTVPRKAHRQRHQQHRIDAGVRHGDLTRGEARKLENEQAHIEATKERAKADGVVTPAEKRRLDRQQNAANRHIYNKKHNASVPR